MTVKHDHRIINAYYQDDKERDCRTVFWICRDDLAYWALRLKNNPAPWELEIIREFAQPFYDQGMACFHILHPEHSRRTTAE